MHLHFGVHYSILLLGSLGLAQDWARFRGPNGTGVALDADPPVEFGPEKNLAWKTPLAEGLSSPVLAGGWIFLTALEEEQLVTYGLNLQNGKVWWRRIVRRNRAEKLHKLNHAAAPSPASDGKDVFVFFPDFGLLAYSAEGDEKWRQPLGPFSNLYGMGASPILAGDKVILACDQSKGSFIAAFDRHTGRQAWRTERPEALSGHSTPVLYQPLKGGPKVIAPGSFRMDAYDLGTGRSAWWVNGLPGEMKSVPVIDGDRVFVHGFNTPENDPERLIKVMPFDELIAQQDRDGDKLISKSEATPHSASGFVYVDLSGDGKLDRAEWEQYSRTMRAENALLVFRAGGEGDRTAASLLWKFQRSIPQLPSPLVYRDVVYLINESGVLTTLDAATGKLFQQSRLRSASDRYYASPVAAGGRIYIASHTGVVTVLAAGGEPKVLAVNDLGEELLATPAIEGRRLFVRTRSALYCFRR